MRQYRDGIVVVGILPLTDMLSGVGRPVIGWFVFAVVVAFHARLQAFTVFG